MRTQLNWLPKISILIMYQRKNPIIKDLIESLANSIVPGYKDRISE